MLDLVKLVFGGSKRLRNFIFGPQEGWGVLFFFFLMTLQHIKSPQGLEHPDRVSMETKPVSGPGPAWPYPPSLGLLAEDHWDWGRVLLGRCRPSSWLCSPPRPDTRSCLGLGRRPPAAGTTVATYGALGCHRRCAQPPTSAHRIHATGFSIVVL